METVSSGFTAENDGYICITGYGQGGRDFYLAPSINNVSFGYIGGYASSGSSWSAYMKKGDVLTYSMRAASSSVKFVNYLTQSLKSIIKY